MDKSIHVWSTTYKIYWSRRPHKRSHTSRPPGTLGAKTRMANTHNDSQKRGQQYSGMWEKHKLCSTTPTEINTEITYHAREFVHKQICVSVPHQQTLDRAYLKTAQPPPRPQRQNTLTTRPRFSCLWHPNMKLAFSPRRPSMCRFRHLWINAFPSSDVLL